MAEPNIVPPDDPATATRSPPEGASHERILIAEDDAFVRSSLVGLLRHYGYRPLEAADGLNTLRLVFEEKPDLIILDIEMPGLGGLEVLRRLRATHCTLPVLILSSRSEVAQRVEGLSVGADDYLPKPFSADELLARVKALLRRLQVQQAPAPRRISFGDRVVDLNRKVVEHAGRAEPLSRTECSMLELLLQHKARPVSRALMMEVVWGYTSPPATRTIDTHVWRLRKKIGDTGEEPRWLKNVSGIGYQLLIGS